MNKQAHRPAALCLCLALLLTLLPAPKAQAATTNSNTTKAKAIQVTDGETVTINGTAGKSYYYYVEGDEASKIINFTNRSGSAEYATCDDTAVMETCTTVSDLHVFSQPSRCYFVVTLRNSTASFTVEIHDNDENEPNNTAETATPLEDGKSTDLIVGYQDVDYFSIQATKPGQDIQVDLSGFGSSQGLVYLSVAGGRAKEVNTDGTWYYHVDQAGAYMIEVSSWIHHIYPLTLTATLYDGDKNEPNDTPETATALNSGESTDILLCGEDMDYFSIRTTKPGQDIQIDLSGFNYAVQGTVILSIDDETEQYISSNGTYSFHMAQTGAHTICLTRYVSYRDDDSATRLPLNLTATVLDGDENEPNDTLATATPLLPDTDEFFSVGGWGDEDWFTFEASPEAEGQDLYTLNFLDLNTDYSDQFYYDVYAPDGSAVVTGTYVDIRHSNILACDQQGLYAVRVYAIGKNKWGGDEYCDISRSTLRIRVDEGGADPYENNDTWLTASPVQTDQPINFVLSNTTDQDWFSFSVPEADMTLTLTLDSTLNWKLYSGEKLQEYGADSYYSCLNYYYSNYSNGVVYYKFTDPGTYYLCLSAETSYVSEDLRTMTLNLDTPKDVENNDYWKNATPIYEGVPQSYDLTAYNDVDWFKIEVPEGTGSLVVKSSDNYLWLYRETDLLSAGDDAREISYTTYGGTITLDAPAAGTYYVKCNSGRALNQTINYALVHTSVLRDSIDTATTLLLNQWYESTYGGYFNLGELKAGDEVRVSADGAAAKIYLKNSGGSSADDFHSGNYHAYSFLVPSDGIYYLYVDFDATLDANGEFKTYRLRYDVGNQTYGSASIEGPDELTMKVGETVRPNLRITPYDADLGRTDSGLIFSFSSNNYSVAYGNSFGCILAKSVGDATISVSAYNSACTVEKKTILVHVVNEDTAATATPTTPTTQLSIQNPPDSLALGEKAALTAVQDAGASEAISWSSSDTGVLYVSSKGVVTAVGRGSAEITATSASGVKASVTIAVTAAPEVVTVKSVRLDQTSLTLYLGEGSAQLTATVLPADATNGKVTWTSYNTQAATVDQNGLVTPVGQGVATITASAGGYKASCTVTVQPQRVRVTGISFSETDHDLPLHSTVTLLPTVAPGNATVKTLTWVSDDPTVATVSRTGIVTGVSVGSTTVTATTVDGGYSAQITIHVTASAQLGDINMDGYIDSADAMMALKVAVGKITLTAEQTKAADVNHDGYVDAADAVKILRYDAGLIDALT